jgi:FixJ family two-component response regulator
MNAIIEEPVMSVEEPTVFFVDDDPGIRESLRWLLESVGLRLEAFASAREFLEKFDKNRPGCLILDIRMPGMGGLDLQEHLRAEGCTWPVIILTSHGDIPLTVRAMRSGAIQVFEKPVGDQMLIDEINAALAKDREQRQAQHTSQSVLERYQTLTRRESEVLDHVANGLSSKEIGKLLGVSYKTIEAHRAKIMRKMHAAGVPELVRLYLTVRQDASRN